MDVAQARVLVVGNGPDADDAAGLLVARGAHVERAEDGAEAVRLPVADILVVDEWTAEDAPHVVRTRSVGARVTVPAEIILDAAGLPVIAVTGSAGKTSTARLIDAVLRAAGRCPAIADARGGNAWPNHTLLDGRAEGADVVVAELTSTHLCHMRGWGGASLAVLTVLWPDHVELHGSVAAYEAAKTRLLDGADRVVAGIDDDVVARLGTGWTVDAEFSARRSVEQGAWIDGPDLSVARRGGAGTRVMALGDAPRWAHPGSLLAAAAAGVALGIPATAIRAGVAGAEGPPHRMASVGTWRGRELIDDSVCATPSKLVAALARCPVGATVLVVGGRTAVGGRRVHRSAAERDAVVRAIAAVARTARLVVPFGDAATLIRDVPVTVAEPAGDLAAAIVSARELSRAGDTIIVSPMFPVSQEERDAVPGLLSSGR